MSQKDSKVVATGRSKLLPPHISLTVEKLDYEVLEIDSIACWKGL